MGSLGVLAHTGYTGVRHMVFMLHGKGQRWSSMYTLYCTTTAEEEHVTHSENGGNTVTDPCPPLSFAPHLVYAFVGSGKIDSAFHFTAGFSTNIFDAAYDTVCNAMESDLVTHIGEAATDAITGWDVTTGYFTSDTEIMSVGFSDGGGASVWMQYQGTFGAVGKGITQVIAIDYWAFNSYETWFTLPSTPGVIDMKIYTNCYSGIFIDGQGSEAIFPKTSSDTQTLPLVAGYAGPTVASGYYTKYDWEASDGSCKRFSFWVHGLSSTGTAADWAPNSTFWTTAGSCTDPQMMFVPINSSVHFAVALDSAASVITDIEDWVAAPPTWDPNSPSSIPCYDSPSPPPPSPIYKPKPKPWQKPKPHEKWFAKFVDPEDYAKKRNGSRHVHVRHGPPHGGASAEWCGDPQGRHGCSRV
jgi:hypothetical protein